MAPFPHPAHRTGRADFPHPALGQTSRLRRCKRHCSFLKHLLELIGFPISEVLHHVLRLFELTGPFPPPGVTRLSAVLTTSPPPPGRPACPPGLPVVIADHALGLPVFRALSLCTCRRHLPAQRLTYRFRSFHSRRIQSSPVGLPGRPAHCRFRGFARRHSALRPATPRLSPSCTR